MVRKITFNDGKDIPALGWGSGSNGTFGAGQKAIDCGAFALSKGILHIDTAQVYRTEAEAGEAIKKAGMKKEDVWLTTKISENTSPPTNYESIRKVVDESISKLTFIPDLILIHNPFIPEPGKIGEFWSILEDLVHDGTLKGCSLGVSNFRPQDLEDVLRVAKIKPVCNQMEYHPYVLVHVDPVIKIQDQHNIVTQAYSPLTPILRHPTGGPLKPILERIANRLSTSVGKTIDTTTVLLLWTMGKGVVAITSSSKDENIKKLGEIDTLPDLTRDEMNEIERVGRTVHYRATAHMTKDFPEPDLPDGTELK